MKKTITKLAASAMAVVAMAFGVLVPISEAVEAKRMLALSPMSQKIMLVPGETFRGSITVSNPADATEDLYYRVEIAPYTLKAGNESKDDYGDYTTNEKTELNDIVDWMKLKNEKGVLKPNELATVGFTINVPKDAPAGVQYAALLVSEDSQTHVPEGSVGVAEVMKMAHVIYAEVAGKTVEEAEILDNNIPSFVLNNTLEASSMVYNKGNIYADAEYILQVWPMGSDEEICTNEENAEDSLVLPNTKKYHQETCNLPSVGIYRVKQTVKIFGEKSEIEKMVIYCPIWMMLVILFGIAMIVIWLVMQASGRKKSARRA